MRKLLSLAFLFASHRSEVLVMSTARRSSKPPPDFHRVMALRLRFAVPKPTQVAEATPIAKVSADP